MQDSLQRLPVEKWGVLQNVFKSDLPRSLLAIHLLETQKLWLLQGVNYKFTVYCPYGNISSGMVAVIDKSGLYDIIIQCPRDDTEELEDAIKNSKIINWNKTTFLQPAPDHIIACVKRISTYVNAVIREIVTVDQFVLNKTSTTFVNIRLPSEITFRLLSSEHINIVDSLWPHRYPTSNWYFDTLISSKSGYGLFIENTLIAWVFIFDNGSLGHLYVIEEHRRKGYAGLITKLICNILLEEGKDVFAQILKTNMQSLNLFNKLGFIPTNNVSWVIFNYLEDQENTV